MRWRVRVSTFTGTHSLLRHSLLPSMELSSSTAVFAAAAAARRKRRIVDPIEARVQLIDGDFAIPPANKAAVAEIRAACKAAAKRICAATRDLPSAGTSADGKRLPGYDTGRLIAALDTLQQAKNIACVSVFLPYAEVEEDEPLA